MLFAVLLLLAAGAGYMHYSRTRQAADRIDLAQTTRAAWPPPPPNNLGPPPQALNPWELQPPPAAPPRPAAPEANPIVVFRNDLDDTTPVRQSEPANRDNLEDRFAVSRHEPRPDPELERIRPIFIEWAQENFDNYEEVMKANLPDEDRPRVLHTRVSRRVNEFVTRHRLGAGNQLRKIILTGITVNEDGNLLQDNPNYALPDGQLGVVKAVLEMCETYEQARAQENEKEWQAYLRAAAHNIAVGNYLNQAATDLSNRHAMEIEQIKQEIVRRHGRAYP